MPAGKKYPSPASAGEGDFDSSKSGGGHLDTLIIGAGITGLSCAFHLIQKGIPPNKIRILESQSRVGGKIGTHRANLGDEAFLFETGPDSFLAQKPWAYQLALTLGLQSELIGTNDASKQILVLKDGLIVPLPEGMMLMVPTKIMPFVLSPLFSWPAKLRMALEMFVPRTRKVQDESVASFVTRRLGKQAFDYLAEPLLSGIYSADPHKQSLRATFPKFWELEQQHGSLLRAMLSKTTLTPPSPAQREREMSTFLSFRHGMQTLTDALEKSLGATVLLNHSVSQLTQNTDGSWLVEAENKTSFIAKNIILTLPPKPTSSLLKSLAPQASSTLDTLRGVSSGSIYLAYKKADISNELKAFGIVIPAIEKRPINAVTFVSSKLDHRCPSNYVLLRVFFGGSRNELMTHEHDAAILDLATREVRLLLGIKESPVLSRIFRWHDANPQYDVGHLDLMKRLNDSLPKGIFLAGSAYGGVGIPDCIKQAEMTSQHIYDTYDQKF